MREVEASWRGLRSVLWNSLHLSIVGYPFVNPGPIGGAVKSDNDVIDPELFRRWWQLNTFLPVVHIHAPPAASLPSDKVRSIALFLTRQWQIHFIPFRCIFYRAPPHFLFSWSSAIPPFFTAHFIFKRPGRSDTNQHLFACSTRYTIAGTA